MFNRHSGLSLTGALLSSAMLFAGCSAETGAETTTDHVDVQIDNHVTTKAYDGPWAMYRWVPPPVGSPPGNGMMDEMAVGPNATRFTQAFEHAMRAAAKQLRSDFPVTYSAATTKFSTTSTDVEIKKAVEMLNNIDDYDANTKTYVRCVIGTNWATIKGDFDQLFALIANKSLISSAKINGNSKVPYHYSYLVEPQSGFIVLSQLHDFAPRMPTMAAANTVTSRLATIFGNIATHLAPIIRDGDLTHAICTYCDDIVPAGAAFTTTCSFDPPSDGTAPASTPSSTPGSVMASALVSTSAIGCLPSGTALGQPCVLSAFTTPLPNYVTTPTVISNTTYVAYESKSAVARVCPSLVQCKVK
jgi:hypothetical protein